MDTVKVTRELAKNIHEEIKAAVLPVCERHGLKLARWPMRYDDMRFCVRLEMERLDASGVSEAERQSFRLYGELFGVSADDYGKVICNGRRQFRLVAIEPNRPKYPFVGEDVVTGKRFKLMGDPVVAALKALKA